MADRYWVGGGATTNWSATGNTNWSATDGGANNASVPTTGDNVFFKSSANCVLDVNTGSLSSFDMTGYTGSLTGVQRIQVSPTTGSTVLKLVNDASTGVIDINPSSGATVTVTMNGNSTHAGILISCLTAGINLPLNVVILQCFLKNFSASS